MTSGGYTKTEAWNLQLQGRIQVLEKRLRECANALEDEVLAKYPADLRDQYPDIYGRKFKRDIGPVMRARAALGEDG